MRTTCPAPLRLGELIERNRARIEETAALQVQFWIERGVHALLRLTEREFWASVPEVEMGRVERGHACRMLLPVLLVAPISPLALAELLEWRLVMPPEEFAAHRTRPQAPYWRYWVSVGGDLPEGGIADGARELEREGREPLSLLEAGCLAAYYRRLHLHRRGMISGSRCGRSFAGMLFGAGGAGDRGPSSVALTKFAPEFVGGDCGIASAER